MRFGLLVIIFCGVLGVSGCFLSSTPSLNWSENIAIKAASTDPKINDDNIYTEGQTSPLVVKKADITLEEESEKFTEAVLIWNVPQTIQHIVVKAKEGQLEFFQMQYMDEDEEWITVREARDNIRPVYKFTLRDPIVTTKFRLKVPRRWDSKYVGGQMRATRSETGAPTSTEFRNIQEIEIYYALPTPDAEASPMQ